MPYVEANGGLVYADVVMDPAAVTSRMNPGRIYEHYFGAMSRKTQYEMRKVLNHKHPNDCTDDEILNSFTILLGLLKIIGTEQYEVYSKLTNIEDIREIITECVVDEVYILYRVSSEKRGYQIVLETKGTIYEPELNHAYLNVDGKVVKTKDKVLIAPNYVISLAKTGETFLTVSSSKTNHFGIPIGINASNKYSLPYRASPTKVCSETETRLYRAYTGARFTAELLDRASNPNTHKVIYKNILESKTPTNIDVLIDRNKEEYGNVAAMDIVNNLLNSSGVEIVDLD